MYFCSYDRYGNLFVSGVNQQGFALAELAADSGTLTDISLKNKFTGSYPIQWDGDHLAIGSYGKYTQRYFINRATIVGTTARVVGRTELVLKHGYFRNDTDFVIRGSRVVVIDDFDFVKGKAIVWGYPRGGAHIGGTQNFGSQYLDGVTISAAPNR